MIIRHLRLVRQERDVDLFEGFDFFSCHRLAEFIEQLLRAYWTTASINAFQWLVHARVYQYYSVSFSCIAGVYKLFFNLYVNRGCMDKFQWISNTVWV